MSSRFRARRRSTSAPFDDALAAARRGEEHGWRILLDDLTPPALAYLRSRGIHDAEDVFGDVLLDVVRRLPSFEGDASAFRSWFFVVAHSKAVDVVRRRTRRPETMVDAAADGLADIHPGPEETALADVDGGDLAPFLALLTDEQREVLLLRVVAGRSAVEVAEIVGKQPDAVRALQSRALATIRAEISRQDVTS